MLYTWNLHNTVNQLYLKGGGGRNYKAVWLLREEGLRSGEKELDDLRGKQWPGFVLKRMSPPERAQRAGHVNKRRQNPQKGGDSWAFWENLHAGVQEQREGAVTRTAGQLNPDQRGQGNQDSLDTVNTQKLFAALMLISSSRTILVVAV